MPPPHTRLPLTLPSPPAPAGPPVCGVGLVPRFPQPIGGHRIEGVRGTTGQALLHWSGSTTEAQPFPIRLMDCTSTRAFASKPALGILHEFQRTVRKCIWLNGSREERLWFMRTGGVRAHLIPLCFALGWLLGAPEQGCQAGLGGGEGGLGLQVLLEGRQPEAVHPQPERPSAEPAEGDEGLG